MISPSKRNMSLISIFLVILRKVMHTNSEVPEIWGLDKNMNCAFSFVNYFRDISHHFSNVLPNFPITLRETMRDY